MNVEFVDSFVSTYAMKQGNRCPWERPLQVRYIRIWSAIRLCWLYKARLLCSIRKLNAFVDSELLVYASE